MRITLIILIIINSLVAFASLAGGKGPIDAILGSISFLSVCVLLAAQAVMGAIERSQEAMVSELKQLRDKVPNPPPPAGFTQSGHRTEVWPPLKPGPEPTMQQAPSWNSANPGAHSDKVVRSPDAASPLDRLARGE